MRYLETVAREWNRLGYVYANMGGPNTGENLRRAAVAFLRARDIYWRGGAREAWLLASENLGYLYLARAQPDRDTNLQRAANVFREIEEAAIKDGFDDRAVLARCGRALAYAQMQSPSRIARLWDALRSFEDCLKEVHHVDDVERVLLLNNTALIYEALLSVDGSSLAAQQQRMHLRVAEAYLLEALSIAEKIDGDGSTWTRVTGSNLKRVEEKKHRLSEPAMAD